MQDELRYRVRHELFLRPDQTTIMLPPSNRADAAALKNSARWRASLIRASSLSKGRMISSTPRTSPIFQSLRGD